MKRFILFSLALLSLVPIVGPNAVAASNYSEGFEAPDLVGDLPFDSWYSFTTTGAGQFQVTSTQAQAGIQSYIQTMSGAASGNFDVSGVGVNFCSGGYVSFYFRLDAFAGAGSEITILQFDGTVGLTDGHKFQVEVVNTDGAGNADLRTGVVSTTGNSELTHVSNVFAVNTWYGIRVRMDCSNAKMTTTILDTGNSYINDNTGSISDVLDVMQVGSSTDGAASFVFLDSIDLVGVNDPPVPASATSSAFTALYGFSIDRTGSLAIVRTDSGDFIRTLGGINLVTAASEETDCTRKDAVFSQNTPTGPLMFYLDCEPGGNPDTFKIRTNTLAVPDVNDCDDADCWDLDSNEFESTSDDDVGELAEMVQIPIDLAVRESTFTQDFWKLAWAWAGQGSRAGEVGVAVQTICIEAVIDICDDDFRMARQNFGGDGTPPSDICTDYSEDLASAYLAVADPAIATKVYPVSFTNTSGQPNGADSELRAGIGSPGIFTSGEAVACGSDRVAVVYSSLSGFSVNDVADGSLVFEGTCACTTRGIALSRLRGDGKQFVAVLDNSQDKWFVYNMTGSVVATGLWTDVGDHWVEMDENAQNLFIASNNRVQRFEIRSSTGTVGSSPGPTVGPGAEGGGLFVVGGRTVGAVIGTSLGVGTFGGNLMLGVMTILFCIVITLALFRHPVGYFAGAVLGTLLAWAFGFFNAGTIFFLAIAGVFGIFVMRGR